MSKAVKRLLASSLAAIMIASTGATISNINIHAKSRHTRTHRVYHHRFHRRRSMKRQRHSTHKKFHENKRILKKHYNIKRHKKRLVTRNIHIRRHRNSSYTQIGNWYYNHAKSINKYYNRLDDTDPSSDSADDYFSGYDDSKWSSSIQLDTRGENHIRAYKDGWILGRVNGDEGSDEGIINGSNISPKDYVEAYKEYQKGLRISNHISEYKYLEGYHANYDPQTSKWYVSVMNHANSGGLD